MFAAAADWRARLELAYPSEGSERFEAMVGGRGSLERKRQDRTGQGCEAMTRGTDHLLCAIEAGGLHNSI